MKKVIALILALAMVFALAACGGKDGGVRMGSLSDFDSPLPNLSFSPSRRRHHARRDHQQSKGDP